MTIQTQTPFTEPAAKDDKRLAWLWRIVNAAIIVMGIFCGYSLESRHQVSAAEVPVVRSMQPST